MTAWVRVGLRYLAAYLVAKGLLPTDVADLLASDPDLAIGVEAVVGLLLGGLVEGWYLVAKRLGWRT